MSGEMPEGGGCDSGDQGPDSRKPVASDANMRAAQRSDRVANGIERIAFKLHDFGNWLMGFLR